MGDVGLGIAGNGRYGLGREIDPDDVAVGDGVVDGDAFELGKDRIVGMGLVATTYEVTTDEQRGIGGNLVAILVHPAHEAIAIKGVGGKSERTGVEHVGKVGRIERVAGNGGKRLGALDVDELVVGRVGKGRHVGAARIMNRLLDPHDAVASAGRAGDVAKVVGAIGLDLVGDLDVVLLPVREQGRRGRGHLDGGTRRVED